jgi:hypothetical protein
MHQEQKGQLADINIIRRTVGIPIKSDEREKGIKGIDGFYWGFPDGFDRLNEGWIIYYEIENGQHHPDTNVLKYWPILEEHIELKIILIQWLQRKPKSRNRWELSKFVARKMEIELRNRFKYFFIEDEMEFETKLSEVRSLISQLK